MKRISTPYPGLTFDVDDDDEEEDFESTRGVIRKDRKSSFVNLQKIIKNKTINSLKLNFLFILMWQAY